MFRIAILFCCLAVVFLSGCAQQQAAIKKRFLWPPLPDQPKIEWTGAYASNLDLKERDSLMSAIVGEEDPLLVTRPLAIASDGKGKVFVSLTGAIVLIFNFNTHEVDKLGGNALAGVLERVTGLALDDAGNVYVADSATRKVHIIDTQNRPAKVLDFSKDMDAIGFIAFDRLNRRLVLPDPKGNKVVAAGLDGKLQLVIGKPAGKEGVFNRPNAVAIEKDGTIVVADSFNAVIKRYTSQGEFINKFGQRGDGNADFSLIKGVAVDSEGHIYITDGKASKVLIFSGKGEALFSFGVQQFQPGESRRVYIGGFNLPQGIYIDQSDRIYIADQLNHRFQVFQYLNQDYLTQHPLDLPAPASGKERSQNDVAK